MPNRSSADAAKKLPITSPTPVAPTRKPRPMLPPPRSSFTSGTSATFTNAVASAETFQATSTVSSGRERKTSPIPARRSSQCPRVIGSSERSERPGILATSAAESRNVAALTQ